MLFYEIRYHAVLWNSITCCFVKFDIMLFYESCLYYAIHEESIEIIKLLLENENLDINFLNIHFNIFYTIMSQIFYIVLKLMNMAFEIIWNFYQIINDKFYEILIKLNVIIKFMLLYSKNSFTSCNYKRAYWNN